MSKEDFPEASFPTDTFRHGLAGGGNSGSGLFGGGNSGSRLTGGGLSGCGALRDGDSVCENARFFVS